MRTFIASLDRLASDFEKAGFIGLASDLDSVTNTVQASSDAAAVKKTTDAILSQLMGGQFEVRTAAKVGRYVVLMGALLALAGYAAKKNMHTNDLVDSASKAISPAISQDIYDYVKSHGGKDAEGIKGLVEDSSSSDAHILAAMMVDPSKRNSIVQEAVNSAIASHEDEIAKSLVEGFKDAGLGIDDGDRAGRAEFVNKVSAGIAGSLFNSMNAGAGAENTQMSSDIDREVHKAVVSEMTKIIGDAIDNPSNSFNGNGPVVKALGQAGQEGN